MSVSLASRTERPRQGRGFTVLELLTAMALLIAILAIVFSVLDHGIGVWRQANAKIDAFQNARATFEAVTSQLSQATLGTYWDYYNSNGEPFRLTTNSASFVPARYGRYSDLHFVCGSGAALVPTPPQHCSALATQAVFFTVPTGLTADPSYRPMPDLLTASGFFVAFGSDEGSRPGYISNAPPKYRWRLMELCAPTETLEVFASSSGNTWFTKPIANGDVRPLADNIIALVIWPRLSFQDDPEGDDIAQGYGYDSRTTRPWSGSPLKQPVQAHQLPPIVQVTMVAIDETSALRLQSGSANAAVPPSVIDTALAGLFQVSDASTTVTSYANDLKRLENNLVQAHINYRVFSTTVALRESRWTP